MTQPRLNCLTPGCPNTILPATAARTGGYCGPCDGERKRAVHEAVRRQNLRHVDPYRDVTDPAELLWLMHEPRKYEPLLRLEPPPKSAEALCAELRRAAVESLMSRAAEAIESGQREPAEQVARLLAAFTDFDLDPMLERWTRCGQFRPSIAFRSAGPVVRDEIIEAIRQASAEETLLANHALSALAWIGDGVVTVALREWDKRPPACTAGLHIKPSEYATVAGWELTPVGRRDLTFRACVALSPAPATPDAASPVSVARPAAGACPWCRRRLVSLVSLDLGDARLPTIGLSGDRLDVLTCEVCSCFGTVYAEVDSEGLGHWSDVNVRPAHAPDDSAGWESIPWATVAVECAPRNPLHAADQFLPTNFSQIGGHPAWVQDPSYPACPRCRRTMRFLSQIDNGAFPVHEGTYYAFVCCDCRFTATEYQQT